jgi:hypothetical protein
MKSYGVQFAYKDDEGSLLTSEIYDIRGRSHAKALAQFVRDHKIKEAGVILGRRRYKDTPAFWFGLYKIHEGGKVQKVDKFDELPQVVPEGFEVFKAGEEEVESDLMSYDDFLEMRISHVNWIYYSLVKSDGTIRGELIGTVEENVHRPDIEWETFLKNNNLELVLPLFHEEQLSGAFSLSPENSTLDNFVETGLPCLVIDSETGTVGFLSYIFEPPNRGEYYFEVDGSQKLKVTPELLEKQPIFLYWIRKEWRKAIYE